MSILFADSNCDLHITQVKQFGIEYINMPFSLLDGKVEEVSVDFYEEFFTPYLEQGNNLVYVHEGARYLNSLANLKRAVRRLKTSFPETTITLVDSGSTSCGYAYVVYQSLLKHKTGCTDMALANFVKKVKNEVVSVFSLNTANKLLEHGIDIKVDNALIKPIVKLENDNFEVIDKVTNRKKMYTSILNAIEKYGENVADYSVFISYTGNEIDANEMQVELEKYLGHNVKILINKMNPFDTHYVGNKTLAVSFHKKID